MSTRYVFLDETKRAGYVVAAVVTADADAARRVVRGLIVPGRRRLHMHNETARQRRIVASTLATMPLKATMYDAAWNYRTDREARGACLTALIEDLARTGERDIRLVIEQDDSLVSYDNQRIIEGIRATRQREVLHYEHRHAYEDLALGLADSAAWCWVRSGKAAANRSDIEPRPACPPLESAKPERRRHQGGVSGSLPEAQRNKHMRITPSPAPASAKPERHVRPYGSRAHFPRLRALGTSHRTGTGPSKHEPVGHRSQCGRLLTRESLRFGPVTTGRARLLGVLATAHVEYVVIGGTARRRLRLAVSAHPANLAALGRVLSELDATLMPVPTPRVGGVRRVGASLGMLRVHVPGVDVELIIGGPGRSLYAELREAASEEDCEGVSVLVAPLLSAPRATGDRSPEVVAGRLLALADQLAKRVPPV